MPGLKTDGDSSSSGGDEESDEDEHEDAYNSGRSDVEEYPFEDVDEYGC
jgi:hypothetical protein